MTQDKINAYMTLYTALTTLAALVAPFTPFLAEEMYQVLVRDLDGNAPESVHLCDFPGQIEGVSDPALESQMDLVLRVIGMGRACRNAANIKNRQPLAAAYVKSASGASLGREYAALVEDELNVKRLEFVDDAGRFVSYRFKPQLRTLGKKLGKALPAVSDAPSKLDGGAAMAELRENGSLKILDFELAEEDLLIETQKTEGFAAESDREVTVALDTKLTDGLIEEGYVREIINKLQTMRKEAGFDVVDRIEAGYKTDARLAAVIEKHRSEISDDVLADRVEEGLTGGYEKEWSINGIDTVFTVNKIG